MQDGGVEVEIDLADAVVVDSKFAGARILREVEVAAIHHHRLIAGGFDDAELGNADFGGFLPRFVASDDDVVFVGDDGAAEAELLDGNAEAAQSSHAINAIGTRWHTARLPPYWDCAASLSREACILQSTEDSKLRSCATQNGLRVKAIYP